MHHAKDGSYHGSGRDGQLLPKQFYIQHLSYNQHLGKVRRSVGKYFKRHFRTSEERIGMDFEEGCKDDRKDYKVSDCEGSRMFRTSQIHYQQENGYQHK